MRTTSTFDRDAFDKTMSYMSRRYAWIGRACRKLIQPMCNSCTRIKYCGRCRINPYIQRLLLQGEPCPDMESIWKKVFPYGK